MSHPNDASSPHDEELPASTTGYYIIFVAIAGLVFLAVGVSFMELTNRVYANVGIAGIQATLLAYYFMHLKQAERLTWVVAGAGLFWVGILFLLLLTDYVTRYIAAF